MKPILAIVILSLLLALSVGLWIRSYAEHKAELRAIEARHEAEGIARHQVLVERFKAARAEGDAYRLEAERAFDLLEKERSRKPPQQQTDEALESLRDVGLDSLRAILLEPVR